MFIKNKNVATRLLQASFKANADCVRKTHEVLANVELSFRVPVFWDL